MRARAHRALLCLALGAVACGRAAAGDAPIPEAAREALARASVICDDLEQVRGLDFESNVATSVQSPDAFKAYVRKQVDHQFGEEGPDGYVQALVRLGALDHAVDLTETYLALMEDQAAAHYDPHDGTYYLLMPEMPAFVLDIISAHELCHALQDQRFDLFRFMQEDTAAIRDNADASLARQCLVEGEATLVMTIWMMMRQAGIDDPDIAAPLAALGIGAQAALTFDQIVAMAESGLGQMDPALAGLAGDMSKLKDFPRFFVETLYAVYIQGAVMVNRVKSEGGWEAVTALYRDPPRSTEQVLHPEKLGPGGDAPFDVRMPELAARLPAGWRLREEDVLGELGLSILLSRWQPDGADPSLPPSAAAGWDGDRYYYFADEGGGELLVWQTVWDTPGDAAEFAVAYRMALPGRFPGARKAWRSPPDSPAPYQVWETEPGRYLKLARQGTVVGIVDTTDRDRVDTAWR